MVTFLSQIQHVLHSVYQFSSSSFIESNSQRLNKIVSIKGTKTLLPKSETFLGLKISSKCVCGRGSTLPGPHRGSSQRSPDPLAGLGEGRAWKGEEGREGKGRILQTNVKV